jgi:N-acetylgalactosamine kinase
MSAKSPQYSIILAAGKGTRMGSVETHKVCFEIAGVPTINRAIATYNKCNIKQHLVVVGCKAEQVIETVGAEYDNAVFVYQNKQNGTAGAVEAALAALPSLPDDSDILLAAGDRLIDQTVIEQLFDIYYTKNCSLAMLAVPRVPHSSQGRIIIDENNCPVAIIEMADVRYRAALGELRGMAEKDELPGCEAVKKMLSERFLGFGAEFREEKMAKAFGPLWTELSTVQDTIPANRMLELISENDPFFDISGLSLSPEAVEASEYFNTSVYIVRAGVLRQALAGLSENNAQKERYLSDIVALAHAAGAETAVLRVQDQTRILGYNNPAELLEVENIINSRNGLGPSHELPVDEFRSLNEWEQFFFDIQQQKDASDYWSQLTDIYSNDSDFILDKLERFLALIKEARNEIGDDKLCCIVRSPGRLNVMGRHVDHQGGNCNLMTIGYEALMVVHPREDDTIRMFNVDREQFAPAEFSISEMVGDLPWDDWLSLVNSKKLAQLISEYGVDWSHYLKAAILRLQKKFSHTKLTGMDIMVYGNVPMAAGLSSSSSLVVGAAEAVVAANRLETFPSQFITLCGEGEWFVGTRGGAADHAAVKLGQEGKIVKVTFFDFAIQDIVPFPDDCAMVVCDSGIKACKSSNAKDQFNHRISCYRIGFMLIKKLFPQYSPLMHHLRDVNVRTLGVPLTWIYRILLHLPESATLDQLKKLLPEEDLDELCQNHQPPADGKYPIRGVVLFGLSEFERARLYADALKEGRIKDIGVLMKYSHDGDRVSALNEQNERIPFHGPDSNSYILDLIEGLESGDPARVIKAQLQYQPGSYHCSLQEIDSMVDIACSVPGVAGAQLAGAGLGGCMMVLTGTKSVESLKKALIEKYYDPAGRDPRILVCRPVAGSGLLKFS